MVDLAAWTDELRARARVLVNGAPREGCVLYWMRVAVRDHENPALDAAIAAANELGTTAFVYHAVSERSPFASDRHHTFILEGARDVARGLRRRGIAYALHVERPGARGPFLRLLAERAFRASGLARYAERRNDAAIDGTSRLSPWLHYGHVSPLRIARDVAALAPSAGRDKFLDELLVWREAAWHFASHTPDLDTLDVLPPGARATLDAHCRDVRDLVSLERLERGRTGDRLWDLAQRSLVTPGELHNNVRMTWGKAIPAWTRTPEEARRALVALNHRYALDGRDPSSYGGLYWCLGLFGRPFAPEQPILGTVRARPTSVHASRLDLDAYAARVSRPARAVGRVAIVGAGVAGLACARTLRDHGVEIAVFDKGRVPGGRLASLRSPELDADLGAQYFTVRDERFGRFVRSWIDDGVVERWDGRIRALLNRGATVVDTPPVERFVGTPSMSAIARHLGRDLEVRAGHRVEAIERRGARFAVAGTVGVPGVTLGPRDEASEEPLVPFGEFDVLVVCLPSNQVHPLVRGVSPALADAVAPVACEPCLALGFAPAAVWRAHSCPASRSPDACSASRKRRPSRHEFAGAPRQDVHRVRPPHHVAEEVGARLGVDSLLQRCVPRASREPGRPRARGRHPRAPGRASRPCVDPSTARGPVRLRRVSRRG